MDLMVKLPTARATVSRRSFSEGGWTLPRLSPRRRSVRAGHRLTVLLTSKTSFRRQHPYKSTPSAFSPAQKITLSGYFIARAMGADPTASPVH